MIKEGEEMSEHDLEKKFLHFIYKGVDYEVEILAVIHQVGELKYLDHWDLKSVYDLTNKQELTDVDAFGKDFFDFIDDEIDKLCIYAEDSDETHTD